MFSPTESAKMNARTTLTIDDMTQMTGRRWTGNKNEATEKQQGVPIRKVPSATASATPHSVACEWAGL